MCAFAKEVLEEGKTKLERSKVELLGQVQSKLKKENKIIYSQSDASMGPTEYQSPSKKGGNHTGGALVRDGINADVIKPWSGCSACILYRYSDGE